MYEFAKEVYFDKKTLLYRNTRDKPIIRMLESLAIIASWIFTVISPKNLDQLYDRKFILLQEKQAGKISEINKEETDAIVEKLLEHKCISTKQDQFLLPKCLNQMKCIKLLKTF